jgi:hypothetical protein
MWAVPSSASSAGYRPAAGAHMPGPPGPSTPYLRIGMSWTDNHLDRARCSSLKSFANRAPSLFSFPLFPGPSGPANPWAVRPGMRPALPPGFRPPPGFQAPPGFRMPPGFRPPPGFRAPPGFRPPPNFHPPPGFMPPGTRAPMAHGNYQQLGAMPGVRGPAPTSSMGPYQPLPK